jgi:hypothetical protein
MTDPHQTTKTSKTPRRWKIGLAVAAILTAGVVGLILWNKSTSERFSQELSRQAPPADPDARNRNLVLGTWEDQYEGKRTMTLNADGTGTMIVELSGWRAAMSAPRLKFNLKWSIEGGHFKEQSISGEPETTVKMILAVKGDHVDQPILELNEKRLLLLDDKDGKTQYDWKRVKLN